MRLTWNSCRGNQPQLALDLLERMKGDGLDMDRMTYGVLMFLHSRKGDHDECIRVYQQMEAVRAAVSPVLLILASTAPTGWPIITRPRAKVVEATLSY